MRSSLCLCPCFRVRWSPLLFPLALLGCSERARTARQGTDGWFRTSVAAEWPDERPQLLNDDVPFRYPVPLFLRKVQGNVTLRLFVEADGRVVPESTRVVEPSGHTALDSSALSGASALRFRPARLRGTAIPVSLLFPVHFRHPAATPVSGDSL